MDWIESMLSEVAADAREIDEIIEEVTDGMDQ